MNGTFATLRTLYDAGAVQRYHTKRLLQPQSVAAHTWGVALVLLWLYAPEPVPSAVMSAALTHDVPEVFTGDTPAPVKWRIPALAELLNAAEREFEHAHGIAPATLRAEDVAMLKTADMAELVMFCCTEADMGNRSMLDTALTGVTYLDQTGLRWTNPRTELLYTHLKDWTDDLRTRYA